MSAAETIIKSTPDFSTVRRDDFDWVTITVHWTTVLAVLAMFGFALSIDHAPSPASKAMLLTAHRSLGMMIWLLTVFRLTWRLSHAHLPEWPGTVSPLQRLGARVSEYGLYGLLLVQPVTGFLRTLYSGKTFQLLAWTVPALLSRNKQMLDLSASIHVIGAWLLAGLIGLHATAALFHLLIRRDGIFESMAPVVRPPRRV